MTDEKYIGYIKYDGELVKDGLMDARRQAKSLLAFDSAVRYFITKQAPDFRNPVIAYQLFFPALSG